MKTPFVTKAQIEEIVKTYPTPFHIYDEKGIRENARKLKQAFAWNKGYKEYFAVKATPNPTILKILKEEGCGRGICPREEARCEHQLRRLHTCTVPEGYMRCSGDSILPLQSGRNLLYLHNHHGQSRRCQIRHDKRAVVPSIYGAA